MKTKVIGILLLTCASLATGQTSFGNYDCGQWFQGPQAAKPWLLGYLTGINFAVLANSSTKYDPLGKKYDPLGNLNSADQAFLWMDNYCKAHPLETVGVGGWFLFQELQRLKP